MCRQDDEQLKLERLLNKYTVVVGVNAIECPACKEINKVRRKQVRFGTLFVPVTMDQIAKLRVSGSSDEVSALCTHGGHNQTIKIEASL